ncbi:hypothetical protein IC620_01420 [Hazenella sp. IB182357]|uniref:Uncharacterized protein n=1 Tax=Polycladospora coralii TaxID=2771432 RepID=A0A926NCE8_9BACL|nr:hypothetical protein [Polycladospora coralii]MBD1371019.1 hypothetical protein [Polycladospora coralii]MBS7529959.1 hypothetical protein [Polycladospora coralii]
MKVFPHACKINIHRSVREMTADKLQALLNRLLSEQQMTLFGSLDIDKEELRIYGYMQTADINEETDQALFEFITLEDQTRMDIKESFDQLRISHEAHFDIIDEKYGALSYGVHYLTFENKQDEGETTYFLAETDGVSEPLACVAEFWPKVMELGRDTDFGTGCTSSIDFREQLKNM